MPVVKESQQNITPLSQQEQDKIAKQSHVILELIRLFGEASISLTTPKTGSQSDRVQQ